MKINSRWFPKKIPLRPLKSGDHQLAHLRRWVLTRVAPKRISVYRIGGPVATGASELSTLARYKEMREPFIVLDFETTGLAPTDGARATEVAAVLVQDGVIADKFQSLMKSGVSIPPFIQELTGITNRMISNAPSNAEVMREFFAFIGDTPLVAHNASFDKKFLDAELTRIGKQAKQPIACSMRIARRVYQKAPNHQLGTLVRYAQIKTDGVFHRALADSEMTARLMLKMADELRRNHGVPDVNFELMRRVQSMVIRDMPSQLGKLIKKMPQR